MLFPVATFVPPRDRDSARANATERESPARGAPVGVFPGCVLVDAPGAGCGGEKAGPVGNGSGGRSSWGFSVAPRAFVRLRGPVVRGSPGHYAAGRDLPSYFLPGNLWTAARAWVPGRDEPAFRDSYSLGEAGVPEAASVFGAAAGAGGPSVSRSHELDLLRQWLRLSRDSAQFVRLSGEPGVGKSHLLRRLTRSARRDGWVVAAGRAPRTGAGRPFDAVVDALDDLLARADGSLFERLGETATRHLASVFPALGTYGAASGPVDHYAVSRAVRAVLGHLAREGGGLLFVVDDAHRACPHAVEFLEHLVRHPPDAPVLTVLAHRSVPAGRHPTGLTEASDDVHQLRLSRLPDESLRALLPARVGPVAAAVALRDAAGVPGLLGTPPDGAGPCPVGAEPGPGLYGVLELALGVPPLVASGARGPDLHCLSSLGWRTACAAALVGDPFLPEVVAGTAVLPLPDVLRGLDELYAEGVVVPDGPGRRFRFVRPVVRARVHHASGAGWRHAARDRAVAALRAAGDTFALAAHLVHADDPTADDLRTLAVAARSGVFRQPGRTVLALRRIVAVAGDSPESSLLRAKALVLAGRPGEAERVHAGVWQRVTAGCPGVDVVDAVVWRARALRSLGRFAQADALLGAAGASGAGEGPPGRVAGASGAAAVRAERLALALERGQVPGGGPDGAVADPGGVRDAVAEGGPGDDPYVRVHEGALLAAADAVAGRAGAARAALDRADRLLDAVEGARMAGWLETYRWLGEAELRLGRAHRAAVFFGRGFDAALRFGQGYLLAPLAFGLGRALLHTGETDSAAFHSGIAADAAGRYGYHWLAPAAEAVSLKATRSSEDHSGTTPLSVISTREREIAELVGAGYTNQRIASRLGISTKTVETHMSRMFKKLGVNSRAALAHTMGRDSQEHGFHDR
ncbi:AAA family ATPase [Streptomyces sp. NPDC001777]|uniref:helix-turn-helix transcriptional regulator n=1 Tax=Streptomyces sp. NPDC001777 TaxID=3364608 RepID=UPI00368BC514